MYKQIITLKGVLEAPFIAEAKNNGEHLFAHSKFRFNSLSKTDETNSHNSWIVLEAWNEKAEAVLKFKPGQKIILTGELFQRRWVSDNTKHSIFKIAVETIKLDKAVPEIESEPEKKPVKARYAKYLPNQKTFSAGGLE